MFSYLILISMTHINVQELDEEGKNMPIPAVVRSEKEEVRAFRDSCKLLNNPGEEKAQRRHHTDPGKISQDILDKLVTNPRNSKIELKCVSQDEINCNPLDLDTILHRLRSTGTIRVNSNLSTSNEDSCFQSRSTSSLESTHSEYVVQKEPLKQDGLSATRRKKWNLMFPFSIDFKELEKEEEYRKLREDVMIKFEALYLYVKMKLNAIYYSKRVKRLLFLIKCEPVV